MSVRPKEMILGVRMTLRLGRDETVRGGDKRRQEKLHNGDLGLLGKHLEKNFTTSSWGELWNREESTD